MLREIKFRAWNGEQMVSPDYIDREGLAWWKENSIPTCIKEIMQYTGLKDKNGKEIYEGDILLHATSKRMVVEWVKDGFWYANEKSIGIGDLLWKWARVSQVIGNIYEKPDLLEKQP